MLLLLRLLTLTLTLLFYEGIDYINMYMHPQAILVDATGDEEDFFLAAVRDEVRSTASALIELPERPGDSLAWVTKLDSAALSGMLCLFPLESNLLAS